MWVSRKKLKEIRETNDKLMNAVKKLQGLAYLVSVERNGRLNKFTFKRGGEVFQIETMGLMSDDINEWKEKLFGENNEKS